MSTKETADTITKETADTITVLCMLCSAEYDVTENEYVCRRCKITICERCKVDKKAIDWFDPYQMEICAECDEISQCSDCNEGVCTMCGGTELCNECGYVLCEDCTYKSCL